MSLQQDLILSLPHFALKQFLPEFVATVLKVFSASKSVYVCMYVCIYIYRNRQKLKSLFLANGNFPDTIQAGTSSWLDYNFFQLDQQAGKLKMFGKFQQSASSSISYPCHVLYQVCVYFIPGGRLEAREKL